MRSRYGQVLLVRTDGWGHPPGQANGTRFLRYSRGDLRKASCRKSRQVRGRIKERHGRERQISRRGVKIPPNWECPNWTELLTSRHSPAAKPSTERKKGGGKSGLVVLSRSPYPAKFTRGGSLTEGKEIAPLRSTVALSQEAARLPKRANHSRLEKKTFN